MVSEKNWKKACKNHRLVQNDCSGGHIFNFGFWIFVCGGQLLSWFIASLTLFFQFSPVCVHPGKQSLSKGFKDTQKIINWHRNCSGGCQYQLLNCWYMSMGQWICVITEWLSIQVIFSLFIIKICIVLGVHSLCRTWWRPRIWFMRIIKWVKAW